jgi:hypothetical protein
LAGRRDWADSCLEYCPKENGAQGRSIARSWWRTASLQHLTNICPPANAPSTLASIYQSVINQATLLSYLDDFKVFGLIFLALLPLLLLVKPGKSGAAQMAH